MFDVAVREDGPLLRVTGSGRARLSHFFGLVDLAGRVARMGGHRRLLVDLTRIEQELAFTEHLQLGAHAAEALAGVDRVATLVTPDQRRGSSEKSAQQHGLRLRTFTAESEALAWLAEP